MRRRVIAALLLGFLGGTPLAADYKYIQADWVHELGITRLAGFKDGEFLVLSDISQRRPALTVRHHLEVRVSALDKLFTTTEQSTDTKQRETLTILLRVTPDPKQFKVEFDHTVYENGEQKFRFAGITFVPRW